MILGFLSDAHGNATGVDLCLDVLRDAGVEQLYFLGDSVGYLPEENAVLERLHAVGALCIRGNHEEMLLGNLPLSPANDQTYRLSEARERIDSRWREWIETWPVRREVALDGRRLLLVHGSPSDPIGGYVYSQNDLMEFKDLPYDVVLMGHTHRPFVRLSGAVSVVNVGSCGLPRDVGDLASCAAYDTSSGQTAILRARFDASALITKSGDHIGQLVIDCLRRRGDGPPVGRIVEH